MVLITITVYLLQKKTSLISVVSAGNLFIFISILRFTPLYLLIYFNLGIIDTKEDYVKGNKPNIDNNYNNNNYNNNSKVYNDMFSKYGLIAMGALVFAVSSAIVLKSCYKRCPSNKVTRRGGREEPGGGSRVRKGEKITAKKNNLTFVPIGVGGVWSGGEGIKQVHTRWWHIRHSRLSELQIS